jgi:NAD(P)-dependent dehydrogenase (short-subunit alcohol dehydrogenase family)
VWVTGAHLPVGRQLASRLLEAGYRVAVSGDRNGDMAGARRLFADSADSLVTDHDITSTSDAVEIVAGIEERLGPLFALVNASSYFVERPVLEIRSEEWRRAVEVNLTQAFFCSRAAARPMTSRGAGRIVMLSSYTAVRAVSGMCIRGATLASAESMMRVSAMELAQHGLCVNAIALGPMAEESTDPPTTIVPMRRPGTVQDAFRLLSYLFEPSTTWLTGAVLRLDGGAEATALLVGRTGAVADARADDAVRAT